MSTTDNPQPMHRDHGPGAASWAEHCAEQAGLRPSVIIIEDPQAADAGMASAVETKNWIEETLRSRGGQFSVKPVVLKNAIDDVVKIHQELNKHAEAGFNKSGSKYLREVKCDIDGKVDVYAVLEAFNVTCPARQHAIKKLLCSGIRGKGDSLQDLSECRDAVDRAIQMEKARHGK